MLKQLKTLKPSQVSLTACGTAYYATLVIRDYLEEFAKIQSRCEVASELRYRSTFFQDNELGVFVSQSGETADTLASQQMFKEKGVKTLSILNAQNTSLQKRVITLFYSCRTRNWRCKYKSFYHAMLSG